MILPLVPANHPALRQGASRVTMVSDEIRTLLHDLEETLDAHEAWGIAAPQVGVPLAICLTRYPLNPDTLLVRRAPTRIFINPEIELPSVETWEYEEDCLSLPDVTMNIVRPVSITVKAVDVSFVPFTERLTGWAARVLLHEWDHCQGILITDYRQDPRDL